jgi:Flp pilus assembly pilin Flp
MQNLNGKNFKRREAGQGLVEYILVVFLMAVLAIVAVQKLGKTTQSGFNTATQNLQNAFQG